MIILHDAPGSDLSHIQAMANIEDGFAMFDYVSIKQSEGNTWIGQIVQPNQNISIVGGRLDPTILHGLELMQAHSNIQSVKSVQIFDILILGQYDQSSTQMLTPRVRPLPGAFVSKLNAEDTSRIIEIPCKFEHSDKSPNIVGELLNADSVPLCVTVEKFNYHVMIAGGTGSGKSNAAANFIDQALKFGKCVLIHDAKPDYGLVHLSNTDKNVEAIWTRFKTYGLTPHNASDVKRIGFYGKCEPNSVNSIVGFNASDFHPEILAGLFFVGSSPAEQNAFEGFASAADMLHQQMASGIRSSYSIDNIVEEVKRRGSSKADAGEAIHEMTAGSIIRKVTNRRKGMPWLDAVGTAVNKMQQQSRFKRSALDGNNLHKVQSFDLESYVKSGGLLVIDYSQMDEQSYALILSYFLRICQQYRKNRSHSVGIVQMVDEAHRIFDNESRHSASLARAFERVMREGRSVDHSIILSLQNASQIPPRVMNNLNTKVVMRQNSKNEADAATQTMGKDFSPQAMRLGTGHALVSMYEARATVLAQMAPSPYELMRNDNSNSQEANQTTLHMKNADGTANATENKSEVVEDYYEFKTMVNSNKNLNIEPVSGIQDNKITEPLPTINNVLARLRKVVDDESFHKTSEFILCAINDPLVLCKCAELASQREPGGMYYRSLLWSKAWELLRANGEGQNQNSQFWRLCNKANVSIKSAKYYVAIGDALGGFDQNLDKLALRGAPSQIFHNAYLHKDHLLEYLIEASKLLQNNTNITPTQIHTKWCQKNGSIKSNLDIIKPSDWWAFSHPKWLKEDDFNGSIPGEIYANALYYFAPPKGIAVDPMAGSGMLKRVYDDRDRWQKSSNFDLEIHLLDLFPKRNFIVKHDARVPLPFKADWIFIDPPYFGQTNYLYEGELASTTNYEEYLGLMKEIIISLTQSLHHKGRLCVFLPQWSGLNFADLNYNVPHDVYLFALEAGLSWIDSAFVSRGRQQEPGSANKNNTAKQARRMRSDTCVLNVFEKRG